MDWDRPQEDEFALCLMGQPSFYTHLAFPNRWPVDFDWLDFRGITEARQAKWANALAGYQASGRRFDTIVLDPPAFAKSRGQLEAATRAYHDLNRRALNLLNPGGVLISCSCSQHMGEANLLEVIAQAAIETGRTLRVLERRAQALDHPVLLTVPETLYLKCLILELA